MISVDELMTPNPFTLSESDSVHDAKEIMTNKHIRHIPIIDEHNQLQGLITQRDILAAGQPISRHPDGGNNGSDASSIKLAHIMTKNVSVIHHADNIRQAAMHMQSHKLGCLPVVNNGKLVGIITDSDFVSIAINLLEQIELREDSTEDDNLMRID